MQFKCDGCGETTDVDQYGAGDGCGVSNDGGPPEGWRTIYTVIEEHDGDNGISTSTGEVLHSCAKCNAQMTLDEHHDAERAARETAMRVWRNGAGIVPPVQTGESDG